MLPAPDDLDRYARHLPEAAERLLTASEREQAHRHQTEHRLANIEQRSIPLHYASQKRGLLITLVLGLAYLAVMATAITAGYALIGAGGAALGTAAILRHRSQELASAQRRFPPRSRPWHQP